jgi:hypothetical protein
MISIEDWEATSRAKAGEFASASGGAPAGATNLPGGGLSARSSASPSAIPTTPSLSPRRNRIVPDPDEPSDLEDESMAPFGDDEATWNAKEGELASASGHQEDASELDEDEEYEFDDDDNADDHDAEHEDAEEAESDDEWEETQDEDEWEEELTEK